jgi:leucyl/phenylalanyl-tRNA--protein transferase
MSPRSRAPVLLREADPAVFPDATLYDAEGLVAIGGDLSEQRLLAAYRQGIFPWYNEGLPILWWSPDPRAVIDLDSLHVSRSLRRTLTGSQFRVSWDQAFAEVIHGCAANREEGTWIVPAMQRAYIALHHSGHAHSVEVWQHDQLVGGLYGVRCGALFAAESMFHTVSNASEVALVHCVRDLWAAGVRLIDVQFLTPHLERCGAHTLSRVDYLRQVALLCRKETRSPSAR